MTGKIVISVYGDKRDFYVKQFISLANYVGKSVMDDIESYQILSNLFSLVAPKEQLLEWEKQIRSSRIPYIPIVIYNNFVTISINEYCTAADYAKRISKKSGDSVVVVSSAFSCGMTLVDFAYACAGKCHVNAQVSDMEDGSISREGIASIVKIDPCILANTTLDDVYSLFETSVPDNILHSLNNILNFSVNDDVNYADTCKPLQRFKYGVVWTHDF